MSALLPKLLVFIVQPAAQYRHCSAAGFAVRRYLLSDCLLKSVSGRFKWGRWSPKVKYGPLLYRSISAHKKSTVMLLSTRDSWKNRFEKVNTVWSVQVAVRYHCNEIHCTHTYVRTLGEHMDNSQSTIRLEDCPISCTVLPGTTTALRPWIWSVGRGRR